MPAFEEKNAATSAKTEKSSAHDKEGKMVALSYRKIPRGHDFQAKIGGGQEENSG